MRKIFFLFWTCGYLIVISAGTKSVSETLNHLAERIDKLNRTYMSIEEKINIIIIKRNEESLELENSEIKTLKESLSIEEKIKIKESSKNRLNLYFGFLLPKNSTFRNYGIHFENGSQFEIEYARRFGSFSLGTSVSGKFFGNDKIAGIPIVGEMLTAGENKALMTSLLAGWRTQLNETVFINGKISVGVAFTNQNLRILTNSITQKDNSFYYSSLIGIGLQWTNFTNTILYYQYDGYESAGNFGDQSFHQIGLSLGLNY
ncbi:MAG: hypothetical protein P8P49_02710 [Opitutales bacterium]|nr:hypothetical protein [Opitutales bacterium]